MKDIILWAMLSGWTIVIVGLIPYLVSLTPKYITQKPTNMMFAVAFGLLFILAGSILTLIELNT